MREYFRSGGKTLPGEEESGLPAVIPGQPGGGSNERVGDDSWEHPPAAYEKGVLTASLEEYQVPPSAGSSLSPRQLLRVRVHWNSCRRRWCAFLRVMSGVMPCPTLRRRASDERRVIILLVHILLVHICSTQRVRHVWVSAAGILRQGGEKVSRRNYPSSGWTLTQLLVARVLSK